VIENLIKSLIKKYLEEESNFHKVTYDFHGNITKYIEPRKISEGHWVNIHSYNNNDYEFEHIRSISNMKGKTTLDIVFEDKEINEKLKLEINNKIVQGMIILK